MHCIYTDIALRSSMLMVLHLGPPFACMALCRHCIQNQHFTFITVRSSSYLIAYITPFTDIAFKPLHFTILHHWPLLHLGLSYIALHAFFWHCISVIACFLYCIMVLITFRTLSYCIACIFHDIAFEPLHFSHIASLVLLHLEPYCIACIHGHIAF